MLREAGHPVSSALSANNAASHPNFGDYWIARFAGDDNIGDSSERNRTLELLRVPTQTHVTRADFPLSFAV